MRNEVKSRSQSGNNLLERSVEEIIKKSSLEKKLKSGKKLRIKFGVDPTAPDIHLGTAVPLRKLAQFQKAGHKVIFLIGDFTALIGDPSGQDKTRPQLSKEKIEENTETYLNQVGKILDAEKTEIRRNSEWYEKEGWGDIINLTSKFTIARILERDDFEKRLKAGVEISVHEILYPIMQAYDSVKLKADLEIGGTDQKFNMLAGRRLMGKMEMNSQDIMTIKLLVGTDGVKKMSKSLANYVGIAEEPVEIFGKIMSIPDEQIMPYFELCTNVDLAEVEKIKNPRDQKARLALEIVKMYHSEADAEKAVQEFDRIFKSKEVPSKIPEIKVDQDEIGLVDFLTDNDLVASRSEAKRLIEQGGVKTIINNQQSTISNIDEKIKIKDSIVLKIGKRKFIKIIH